VDPGDAAAGFLGAADAPEPHRLLDKLSASGYESAEVRFARCRAHLELGDLGSATESLRRVHRAEEWRLAWHRGLLALARGEVELAESEFDAVYDAVPGEDAPKLALGFCSEYRRKSEQADRLYEAVWRRDRSQGSAAFGLTRIRLSNGDRAGAVAVLDEVPKVSRHYDAATIAAVIILSGQLSSGPPSADDLRVAAERLPALYLDGGDRGGDARDRMTAIVREAAFGDAPDIEKRVLLEESYRALARQARDADGHGVLIDLANTIRPWTFR
jgi:serine/threonine-protein kinase PknG